MKRRETKRKRIGGYDERFRRRQYSHFLFSISLWRHTLKPHIYSLVAWWLYDIYRLFIAHSDTLFLFLNIYNCAQTQNIQGDTGQYGMTMSSFVKLNELAHQSISQHITIIVIFELKKKKKKSKTHCNGESPCTV